MTGLVNEFEPIVTGKVTKHAAVSLLMAVLLYILGYLMHPGLPDPTRRMLLWWHMCMPSKPKGLALMLAQHTAILLPVQHMQYRSLARSSHCDHNASSIWNSMLEINKHFWYLALIWKVKEDIHNSFDCVTRNLQNMLKGDLPSRLKLNSSVSQADKHFRAILLKFIHFCVNRNYKKTKGMKRLPFCLWLWGNRRAFSPTC